MDSRIIKLYDEYTHKPLSREVFLKRLAKLTGSTALAMTVLPLLEGNYAQATTVLEDNITVEELSYPSKAGDVKALFAKPKDATGKLGAVVVIHENRGLNAHIKDVTKRVAQAGFIALGIDALSPFGGTPKDEDKGRELIGKLDDQENLQRYLDGLNYLRERDDANGKTACVGFCWGGGMANDLAVHDPLLNAAVAYYGRQAPADQVGRIKAKLLLHYAGLDERINAGIPAYEEALKKNNIDYQIQIYEGVNHAFNNDTSAARYDEQAAKLAWERTLALFTETLKS